MLYKRKSVLKRKQPAGLVRCLLKPLALPFDHVFFLRSYPTKHWHLLRGNECSCLTVKLEKGSTQWLSQWDSESGWRDEKSKASGLDDQKILEEFRCFSEPILPRNHKGSTSLMWFTILPWFQLETTLYFCRFSASSLNPKIARAQ